MPMTAASGPVARGPLPVSLGVPGMPKVACDERSGLQFLHEPVSLNRHVAVDFLRRAVAVLLFDAKLRPVVEARVVHAAPRDQNQTTTRPEQSKARTANPEQRERVQVARTRRALRGVVSLCVFTEGFSVQVLAEVQAAATDGCGPTGPR